LAELKSIDLEIWTRYAHSFPSRQSKDSRKFIFRFILRTPFCSPARLAWVPMMARHPPMGRESPASASSSILPATMPLATAVSDLLGDLKLDANEHKFV
jgi:hypothetical protein